MSKNQSLLLNFIAQKYEAGELDNQDLVECVKLAAYYLNLRPLLEVCKDQKISYPGILKSKRFEVVQLLGKKYVIDNL
jgi:hypothetical protein